MSTAYNVIVFSFALVGLILGIVAITKTSKNAKNINSNAKAIQRNKTNHDTLDGAYETEKNKLAY